MRDILLEEGDLLLARCDLVVGESTLQHQQLLLITQPGEWKEAPLAGVGLTDWLNDERNGDLVTEVRRQFKSDGMTVSEISYANGKLKIDADYEG